MGHLDASAADSIETGRSLGLSFFEAERFSLFHPRIYEDQEHAVYVNENVDFAVIWPRPRANYETYVPRSQKLGVKDPKLQQQYLDARLERVKRLLGQASVTSPRSLLEVGASDGTFLERLRAGLPGADCAGVEPSAPHRTLARERGFSMFESVDEVPGRRFDLVCMFHVFEHFEHPIRELAKLQTVLAPGGVFMIEIPALTDPLVSLYRLPEFKDFYFQSQHPFVYSLASLRRLLEAADQRILGTSCMQRYGLANHLHWLQQRRPGRDDALEAIGAALDPSYRRHLEDSARTDTVFACFAPAAHATP
jgi:SAM-dependent methyltransferase